MPASVTHFITGAELDAGRLDLLLTRAAALNGVSCHVSRHGAPPLSPLAPSLP